MTVEMIQQQEERRLSPVERLEALCDRGSLTLLRSDVRSRRWPPPPSARSTRSATSASRARSTPSATGS